MNTDRVSSVLCRASHNLQQNTALCLRWGKASPFSHKILCCPGETLPYSFRFKVYNNLEEATPGIFRIDGTCGSRPLLKISLLPHRETNEIPPALNTCPHFIGMQKRQSAGPGAYIHTV